MFWTVSNFILFSLAGIFIIYLISLYNMLVNVKNNVTLAYANIDVLLKQRHDELPKLIDVCKQIMSYEKDLLEKITSLREEINHAREETNITALGSAESNFRTVLGELYVKIENYPTLKANDSLIQLQKTISALEVAISDRRITYNDSVNINNTAIESFPANLFVKKSGQFKPCEPLHFE